MKRIKVTGLFSHIHYFIYTVGGCVRTRARSMIMSSELDENLTPDPNEVGLKDLSGFGYIDFNLLVHWDTTYSWLHADWVQHSWNHDKREACLTDQQAILVQADGFKIISP